MLEDFDYYDDADYEYVDMRGEIRRPDLGIVIPVTVQYDGSVLLGDPPVDKIPSSRVRGAVCGEGDSVCGTPLENTRLSIALVASFQLNSGYLPILH